jgi:hypothetical protein
MATILEKQVEQAIKDVIADAAITVDNESPTVRAFLIADEGSDIREQVAYPMLWIMAKPSRQPGHRSVIYEIPVTVTIATHADDDVDRAQLIGFYTEIRPLLEDSAFTGKLSGYTFLALTIDDTDADVIDKMQFYQLACTFRVQENATTTTTTTTTT